jgi:AmmeMemoRadiSam system protein B
MRIRPPAVAGTFYPDDAHALLAEVDGHLSRAHHPVDGGGGPAKRKPKALIAPHAGYLYSGPVAGSSYAPLAAWMKDIQRVVLVGPSHRVPFSGLATSSAAGFATPLGTVSLDRSLLSTWISAGWVQENDAAHTGEHSLEVQLPFLQRLVPDAVIVPVLTGDGDARAVEDLLDHAWGGDETLIVVSSDLSHYQSYESARCQDEATARCVQSMDARGVGRDDACGSTAIKGLLSVAARRGLSCRRLDLRNSGDTAGSRDRVVGYGAFIFA